VDAGDKPYVRRLNRLPVSEGLGGEDDRTMDRDCVGGVGPGAAALGRSGACMSDVEAVLLIFVLVAVALTAVKPRRKNRSSRSAIVACNE
jgi:hypothetical protein